LAKTNIAVRSTVDVSEQSSKWWSFLTEARTFFEQEICS
jgi:hypothetical protein